MFKFLITLLLFTIPASGEVINYGTWKIIKHPPRSQKYWPDDIAVFDDKGEKYYLDKIEDRPILIVFWATWCTHCIKEMPSLDVLKKDFRKLPIEIIAISEDYQGMEIVKKFYEANEIRHLGIFHDYKFKLFGELNMTGLPYAFLVDQNKKIVLSFDGPILWHDDVLRRTILNYIPGNPPEPKNTYKEEFLIKPIKNTANSANNSIQQ
jgi:glutathione peroxidase-family protein